MKSTKKLVAIILATVILTAAVCVGTFAWLTSTTEEVKNTVTVGKVAITLTETGINESNTKEYTDVVPGDKLAKDPKVTVEAGSVDCWLFVEVKNTTKGIDFKIADGWKTDAGVTSADANTTVYYREVDKDAAAQTFNIFAGEGESTLKDGFISVGEKVVAGEAFAGGEITFKAYAIQASHVDSVTAAWTAVTA